MPTVPRTLARVALAHALAATLAIAPCAQAHARGVRTYGSSTYSSYSTQGAALRTTRAGLAHWAATPHAYTLGTYHSASTTVAHATSALRSSHIQALQHCNPFAHASATAPLATCN